MNLDLFACSAHELIFEAIETIKIRSISFYFNSLTRKYAARLRNKTHWVGCRGASI